MYLANGSKGTNSGTITTVGTPKDAIGVVVGKDSEFTIMVKSTLNLLAVQELLLLAE